MKYNESELQKQCIRAFRIMFPKYARRLFAVPNGGFRNIATAARLKAEGVLPGVPDLFLSVPRKGKGGMFIEMKEKKGRLTLNQIAFIKEHQDDYHIIVARSVQEFISGIQEYIREK